MILDLISFECPSYEKINPVLWVRYLDDNTKDIMLCNETTSEPAQAWESAMRHILTIPRGWAAYSKILSIETFDSAHLNVSVSP